MAAFAAVSFLATSAPPAAALTLEDVKLLSRVGLDTDRIIEAIEKARSVFELTASDIDTLQKGGVSDIVIAFMLKTPRVYGAEAQAQRRALIEWTLVKGRQLTEDEHYFQAIEAFQQVLHQGDLPADSAQVYEARFGIAVAMFNAGLHHSSGDYLLKVLLAGPKKPRFVAAFRKLRQLRRRISYSPRQLEEMSRFDVRGLSPTFREEYNYVLGEFFYDYSDWTKALAYLRAVSNRSRDYARVQYLKGLVEIRRQLYRSAAASFEEAARASDGTSSRIETLAYLALARMAYEYASDYDAAVYYYRKIPRTSYKQATALYESSWVYFVKGDSSRALGTFLTLHSPYFEHKFYPELLVLEATIRMNLCHFDHAEAALARFRREIVPLRQHLKRFLAVARSPEDYFRAVVSAVSNKPGGPLPARIVSPILANVEFYNLYQTLKSLDREIGLVTANRAHLEALGHELKRKLVARRAQHLRELGIRIKSILIETESAIAVYEAKSRELAVDVMDQKLRHLQTRGEQAAAGKIEGLKSGDVAIVKTDSLE